MKDVKLLDDHEHTGPSLRLDNVNPSLPCYLPINQSENCVWADHILCDSSIPHLVFFVGRTLYGILVPNKRSNSGLQQWGHRSHGEVTDLTVRSHHWTVRDFTTWALKMPPWNPSGSSGYHEHFWTICVAPHSKRCTLLHHNLRWEGLLQTGHVCGWGVLCRRVPPPQFLPLAIHPLSDLVEHKGSSTLNLFL